MFDLDLAGPAQGVSLLQLLQAYGLGVLSTFTPCVYPLIPITLAIFGAGKESRREVAALRAGAYVIGIATTYTILGVVSARTGILFGSFLGNPFVVGALAFFLFLLALMTLDLIKVSALHAVQTKASSVGGKGMKGAFLMGTVSGVVAAPCIGPVLVQILGFAAKTKDAVAGAGLLFSYSLGFGTLFFLIALFPGFARALPRPGGWLSGVKVFIAVSLLVVSLFLLQPFLPAPLGALHTYAHARSILVAVALAVTLAFVWRGFQRESAPTKLGAVIVAALLSFFLIVPPPPSVLEVGVDSQVGGGEDLRWLTSLEQGSAEAARENKLVMVDLYADWCAACKELDSITFRHLGVKEAFKDFVLVRLDFTESSDLTEQLSARYQVLGLPTLLFLRADGSEVPESRISGFVLPADFVRHLAKVRRTAASAEPGSEERLSLRNAPLLGT